MKMIITLLFQLLITDNVCKVKFAYLFNTKLIYQTVYPSLSTTYIKSQLALLTALRLLAVTASTSTSPTTSPFW